MLGEEALVRAEAVVDFDEVEGGADGCAELFVVSCQYV